MVTLGTILKQIRVSRDITQKQLAGLCSVEQSVISKAESSATTQVNTELLNTIYYHLGIDQKIVNIMQIVWGCEHGDKWYRFVEENVDFFTHLLQHVYGLSLGITRLSKHSDFRIIRRISHGEHLDKIKHEFASQKLPEIEPMAKLQK